MLQSRSINSGDAEKLLKVRIFSADIDTGKPHANDK